MARLAKAGPPPGRWRASWPVWLLVLGLHGLLFIAWPRQPLPARGAPPAAPVTMLRLLWPASPEAAARREPLPAKVLSPQTARQARPAPAAAALRNPAPAEQPAPPADAGSVGQAITLTPAEPPASAPLNLRLPGRGQLPATPAAAALADPRANSPRPTLEARLARSLDTTVTEELLPDGSVRIRRGNDCFIARPTRGSQLDPFSEHAKTAPRSVGSC